MAISDNIKKLRLQHGMTQDEFGALFGKSGKAVSTWEHGKRTPKMGEIQKIADYFGLKKTEIIDDIDDAHAHTSVNIQDERLAMLVELFERLSPDAQMLLISQLSAIVQSQKDRGAR